MVQLEHGKDAGASSYKGHTRVYISLSLLPMDYLPIRPITRARVVQRILNILNSALDSSLHVHMKEWPVLAVHRAKLAKLASMPTDLGDSIVGLDIQCLSITRGR